MDRLEIVYEGAAAQQETQMVTRSILQGLLSPVLRERVNMVNAELAAETRGITVTEDKVKGGGPHETEWLSALGLVRRALRQLAW